jgi:hypothetical protein
MNYTIRDDGEWWTAVRDDPTKKGELKFAKITYPSKDDVKEFIKARWHD